MADWAWNKRHDLAATANLAASKSARSFDSGAVWYGRALAQDDRRAQAAILQYSAVRSSAVMIFSTDGM